MIQWDINGILPSGERLHSNGKIHHAIFMGSHPLFRLGHFQLQNVSSPEGTTGSIYSVDGKNGPWIFSGRIIELWKRGWEIHGGETYLPSGYDSNTAIAMERSTMLLRTVYHGELLNNQRVNDLMIFDQILISVKYLDMIAQIGDQI